MQNLVSSALSAAALLLALSGPASAATPKVGDPAPELGTSNWVMNAPKQESIAKLRGEVVFVEKWGVRCPPCVALIPHVEKLQQTYGKRGLHIFAFEAQNHSAEQIKAKVSEKGGKTYPVSAGGGNNYRGDGGIPVAWLIGVEGKVIWQGNPAAETSKLDQLIEQEVAKVRFPGLGKTDFAPEALKAVKLYMGKDFAKARAEARKLAEDEKASAKAREDGAYLVTKVDELAARQLELAQRYQDEGNYLGAYQTLGWFAKHFKGSEEGDTAKEKLKAFKKDKQLKRELKAALALQKLLAKLQGQPAEVRARVLEKFASSKKVEGTAAAARATSMK